MGALLIFETVGFRHGTGAELLSNVDFALGRGETMIVRARAGAGKSSFARLATGEMRPSRGHVRLFGIAPAEATPGERVAMRRRIGFAGADLPLAETLALRDNVALPLIIAGTAAPEARARADEMLDWLGLGDRADMPPAALSAGEQERARLARAVVGQPELLIVDEPLLAADPTDLARAARILVHLADLGSAVLVLTRGADWAAELPGARRFRIAQGALSSERA